MSFPDLSKIHSATKRLIRSRILKRFLVVLPIVISLLALQLQVMQFSSELKTRIADDEIDLKKDELSRKSYIAAQVMELNANRLRAQWIIDQYNDGGKIIVPEYSSDMYVSGLNNGYFWTLEEESAKAIAGFYSALPTQLASVSSSLQDVNDKKMLINECADFDSCNNAQLVFDNEMHAHNKMVFSFAEHSRDLINRAMESMDNASPFQL